MGAGQSTSTPIHMAVGRRPKFLVGCGHTSVPRSLFTEKQKYPNDMQAVFPLGKQSKREKKEEIIMPFMM